MNSTKNSFGGTHGHGSCVSAPVAAVLVRLIVQEKVRLVLRQPALVRVRRALVRIRADDRRIVVVGHVHDRQGVATGVVL